MGRELERYIKDSMKKGVSEQALRYNLQAAGWSPDQIDRGISKAQRNNSGLIVSMIVLVTVALLGGGFLFLFTNLEEYSTPRNGVEQLQSCEALPNGDRKIDCYGEMVRESYNCEDLTTTSERLYCLRALENYYLQQA